MLQLIPFILKIGELKITVRSGWKKAGVEKSESVADHSWRLAVMSMIIGKHLKVDTDRLIKMALIDDLAESITGDLISGPDKTITREEKIKKEAVALKEIFKGLKSKEEYLQLWDEAQKGLTRESKILKELDKLEMAFQALEYEKENGESKKFDQFWQTADNHIKNTYLKKILRELLLQRKS